jgi:hydroxypyruvate reductase
VIRAGLDAVDAGRLVRRAVSVSEVARALQSAAAVDVIAAGKAAGPMLSAFMAAAPRPLRQAVGMAAEPAPALAPGVRWHRTVHPVPDERSVAAARDALDVATAAAGADLLIVLLSGGASSIMALPVEGVTLADKQKTSKHLLSLGAEIHDLNTVRKHLSGIKGGRLAAAHAGTTMTFALSDVVGDDLSSIGSGPTVPDHTTYADALAALDQYGGRSIYPSAVVDHLERGARGAVPETPKPSDARLANSVAAVIGGIRTAMDGARAAAESLGYVVHMIDEPITGEAAVAARDLLQVAQRDVGRVPRRDALASSRGPAGLCVIAGGETTVRTAGTGKGGRNQEFALALARGLDRLGSRVVAASVGTDGVDGPTDAAGAIVDSMTVRRATDAGAGDIDRYLREHNSYVFFNQLGDLIRTGPTGTNVGDLQVILIS